MIFALWFLAAFGFAFVIGHSKISLAIRVTCAARPGLAWVAALMECVACLGWHLGFSAGVTGLIELPGSHPLWVAGLFLAFATCGVNLLLAKWVGIA